MSLRKKTLIIIAVTSIALLLLLYASTRIILLGSYTTLEDSTMRADLERATTALAGEIDALARTTADYAHWDDTYAFAQDLNLDYSDANLLDSVFISFRVNVMLVVNTSGEIIFQKGFDYEAQEAMVVSPSLPQALAEYPALAHPENTTDDLSGIILLPEGAMLVASTPILTTDLQGPIIASSIWGRYLTDSEIAQLADTVKLSLDMHPLNRPLPADFEAVEPSLSSQMTAFSQPLDEETIAAYTVLSDINGNPGIVLRATQPRLIYEQGKSATAYFLLAVAFTGLIFALTTLLLLSGFVLNPLRRLSDEVGNIGTSGDLSVRVHVSGDDELSKLGGKMNQMLAALQQSQTAFQQTNAELQATLEERSAEQAQKERFYLHAAHELRTPLANFKTRLYLMTKRPEQLPEHLVVMDDVVNEMTTLVDDLLEISRLHRGITHLHREVIPLREVVNNAISSQLTPARRKDVRLEAQLSEQAMYVSADLDRLTEAIANVIRNAINYTEKNNNVSIALSASSEEPPQNAILIVKDRDTHLQKSDTSEIFQPFFRPTEGDSNGTRGRLTIAKEVIELHGGKIVADVEVGQGNVFTIQLPLVKGERKPLDRRSVLG
jgi:sensor domain CHASE-containing protein/nitrogen-specific signal transduction histidine kinase